MSLTSDRCPYCGTPYLSSLAPDATVDDRVCYTCNKAAGSTPAAPAVEDDLVLQPVEGGGSSAGLRTRQGNQRAQMERQIRSSGSRPAITALKSSARMPAAKSNPAAPAVRPSAAGIPAAPAPTPAGHSTRTMPAVRPSSRGSSRILPPASPASSEAPADAGDALELQASAPARSSARMASASPRPSARRTSQGALSTVIVAAVVLLGGTAAYFALNPKSKAPAESERVARTEPASVPAAAAKPAPVTPAAPAAAATKKASAPVAAAPTGPVETLPPATTAVPETKPEAPAPAPVSEASLARLGTSTAKTDLRDEDEEEVAAATNKPARKSAVKPAAPADAAKAPGKADVAEGEKPKGALDDILGPRMKKEENPAEAVIEFDDIRKPKAVVPVTAAEPTIVVEDLTQGDQTPEKQFSLNFQDNYPGWRVRDIKLETSKSSASHRGRENVLVLNPLNDQLPSKLYCTIEVPQSFSSKRPVLLFEVSSKDGGSDWLLRATAMNLEIRARQPIRIKDDMKWVETGIDLTPLAGKRFELALEAYMTPKTPQKVYPQELAYFRNMRLMWVGKK